MATYSIWAGVVPPSPGTIEANDSNPLSLGTVFSVSADVTAVAIRYYHGAGWDDVRGRVGAVGLYTAGGALLASSSTVPAIATGWNDVTIPSTPLTAGGTYCAVVYYPGDPSFEDPRYSAEGSYWGTVTNGPLTGTDGRYVYNGALTFPTNSFGLASYFSDVIVSDTPATSHQTTSWATSWVARARASASWATGWTTRRRASATWSTGWATRGHAAVTWATSWVTRRRASASWATSSTTRREATISWATTWGTPHRAVATWATTWRTSAHPTQTWATGWVVASPALTLTATSSSARYLTVSRSAPLTLEAQHD